MQSNKSHCVLVREQVRVTDPVFVPGLLDGVSGLGQGGNLEAEGCEGSSTVARPAISSWELQVT